MDKSYLSREKTTPKKTTPNIHNNDTYSFLTNRRRDSTRVDTRPEYYAVGKEKDT